MNGPLFGEFMGTMVLILLGDGVVANVLLKKSKGEGSGWIVITTGWGLAVTCVIFTAIACVARELISIPRLPWLRLFYRITGLTCCPSGWPNLPALSVGATLVWLVYLPTLERDARSGLQASHLLHRPSHSQPSSEYLDRGHRDHFLDRDRLYFRLEGHLPDRLDAGIWSLPVGHAGLVLGLCLGGPTGYAMNPARDFGPRVAHFVLPISGKGSTDWGYALVPIIGPLIGGAIAAGLVHCVRPHLTVDRTKRLS